jgi:hypothetical protein
MRSHGSPRDGSAAVSPSGSGIAGNVRLIAFLLLVAVGWLVYQHETRSFKPASERPGWTMYESRRDGWSVRFPDSWHRRQISNVHRGSPYTTEVQAVALSNVDWELTRASCGDRCWSPWVSTAGLPANGIVVQIGWSYGGGFTCTVRHDTPLPLSLASAERTLSRDGAGGTHQLQLMTQFTARLKSGFHILAWIGSSVTKADLDVLDEIVGSISYDPISPAAEAFDMRNGC